MNMMNRNPKFNQNQENPWTLGTQLNFNLKNEESFPFLTWTLTLYNPENSLNLTQSTHNSIKP